MDLASLKTEDKKDENRFVLQIEDKKAFIDYKVGKSGAIYLIHTEVPDDIEGKGVGHKLVRESLQLIEEEGNKIVPLCPFVRAFLKKHPDVYRQILAEGVKL